MLFSLKYFSRFKRLLDFEILFWHGEIIMHVSNDVEIEFSY